MICSELYWLSYHRLYKEKRFIIVMYYYYYYYHDFRKQTGRYVSGWGRGGNHMWHMYSVCVVFVLVWFFKADAVIWAILMC